MPGLYFEEFTVGQSFAHPTRRTVTEADNVFFTAMTHNPAQLHLDEEYAKGTEFGSGQGIVTFLHRAINQRGELVGVTFDGNLESLPVTYLYSDEQARAVHVDVRGIVEALDRVYKSADLLKELGATPVHGGS